MKGSRGENVENDIQSDTLHKYVFKELNPLFLIYRTESIGGKSKFSVFKPESTVKLFLNFPCVVYCYEELRVVGKFMRCNIVTSHDFVWEFKATLD